MIILDSNILIYLCNKTLNRSVIARVDIGFASVSKIEVLGYQGILVQEQHIIEALLLEAESYPLTDSIINRAIRLRQTKKMSLGDAIIAATALVHDYELWTANEEDFAGIDSLRIHNPLHR